MHFADQRDERVLDEDLATTSPSEETTKKDGRRNVTGISQQHGFPLQRKDNLLHQRGVEKLFQDRGHPAKSRDVRKNNQSSRRRSFV